MDETCTVETDKKFAQTTPYPALTLAVIRALIGGPVILVRPCPPAPPDIVWGGDGPISIVGEGE